MTRRPGVLNAYHWLIYQFRVKYWSSSLPINGIGSASQSADAFDVETDVFTQARSTLHHSRFPTILRHEIQLLYLCVALLYMALHCASPSPTHMTPKPSSARIRPTAAHFFDQLKYTSPSQAPTVPPSAAVSWVSDSWLSSGTKRRAIDNTDDDPVYDEFIRYCAPIAASGKVLHESSPSIDVPTDTPCVPLDGPPGDEHYQSRALSPAQVPRHFRGMPWDDRRVRTQPTAPVQPSMPVHRTDDLPSADHRADGHSDTDSDSISAIQRLYKVSTGRLTSPSVFSESSQAREMARSSREPDPTRSGTQPMRADDDDDVSSMPLDVHGMDGSTPARSPATVANRSTDRVAPWLPPTARMMPTEAAQASPQ